MRTPWLTVALWSALVTLSIVACRTAAAAAEPPPAGEKAEAATSPEIDWARVERIEQRVNAGHIVTIQDQEYLDQAKAVLRARRQAKADAARAKLPLRERPTASVSYGDTEEQTLHFWRAESAAPAPLVIYIHGGGYRLGDKWNIDNKLLTTWVSNGISVASINYRSIYAAPLPAAYYDAARAVQFLRTKAADWNIDPARIGVTGDDCGGCMALWLAYHPDCADPTSADPVARQSSRPACVAGVDAHTTMDVKLLVEWFGRKILDAPALAERFGAASAQELLENPKYEKLFAECSPIRYVRAGAPPAFLVYTAGGKTITPNMTPVVLLRHSLSGQKLQAALAPLGVECVVWLPGEPPRGPYGDLADFFIQKLKLPRP